MDIAIRHDVAGHRFIADLGGQIAELTYVEHDAGTLDFHHTRHRRQGARLAIRRRPSDV
ncbi:MAG: hypothetical protein AAB409_09920 [Gemmatimonadota bacterium]